MVLKTWYRCPNCGRTFWKMDLFGEPAEEQTCSHCGKQAHRDRLKELKEDLDSRIGI